MRNYWPEFGHMTNNGRAHQACRRLPQLAKAHNRSARDVYAAIETGQAFWLMTRLFARPYRYRAPER